MSNSKMFYLVCKATGYKIEVEKGGVSQARLLVGDSSSNLEAKKFFFDDDGLRIHPNLNHDVVVDVTKMADGQTRIALGPKKSVDTQCWKYDASRHVLHNPSNANVVMDIRRQNAPNVTVGDDICVWSYHGGDNQLIDIEYIPVPYFYIKVVSTGHVLEMKEGHSTEGTPLLVAPAKTDGEDKQLFYCEPVTGTIRSKLAPNLVLEAFSPDGKTTYICLKKYSGGSLQKWSYDAARKVIQRTSNPDEVMDIRGGPSGIKPYADLCMWLFSGNANQIFSLEYV